MKSIMDFLTLPLSLPISPLWDFIICLVIGEIAYRVAFSYAGDLGSSSGERYLIHWIIRLVVYFIVWSLVCLLIMMIRFIEANWIWVLIATGILAIAGVAILFIKRSKTKRS